MRLPGGGFVGEAGRRGRADRGERSGIGRETAKDLVTGRTGDGIPREDDPFALDEGRGVDARDQLGPVVGEVQAGVPPET